MERKFWRALGWPVALAFLFLCPALWAYSGGTGEPNNPYQIATVEDLIALGNEPNDYNDCFILTADIDLSGYVFDRAVIAPDLNQSSYTFQGTPFGGNFNGRDHVIRNLRIDGYYYVGLFGYVGKGALVSKVELECVDVNGISYVGGLAGLNSGFITQGRSEGAVKGQWPAVGGLVGLNVNGQIGLSFTCGSVEGWSGVGGLVGSNEYGTILSCYSFCSVYGEVLHDAGGLVGDNLYGQIESSYSVGKVDSSSSDSGGLVGNNYEGRVVMSFWDIDTSGQEHSDGGLGLTTQEMQDPNTFLQAGWDLAFEITNGTRDSWEIQDGNYPSLAVPVEPKGMGTPESPYLICDINALGAVWNYPQSHFVLDANLDLSGITWRSAVVPWFEGNFEGGGHVIRHLNIEGDGTLGLFGQLVLGATLSGLRLESVDVNGAGDYIGSLVGFCQQGEIIECSSHGNVRGGDAVGGLVGYLSEDSGILSSYSAGSVNGEDNIGGVVGETNGFVMSCYSTGSASGISNVGGLAGENNGLVMSCYSTGAASGDDGVGGLVGESYGKVVMSYSIGEACGNYSVGGLVGHSRVGRDDSRGYPHVISCYWDIETSGQIQSDGGVGLTTAQMQDLTTFLCAGWDFVGESDNGTCNYWLIQEGDYPELAVFNGYIPIEPNGSGTLNDPYQLTDVNELGSLWYRPGAHYQLVREVDLGGIFWTASVVPRFIGVFDGNGHVITNLTIDGKFCLGLFGQCLPSAVISNLGLEAVDVNGADFYSGGLVGYNFGTIISSYSSGSVSGTAASVGGLVGYNEGRIMSSYSTCLTGGSGRVGGLVGSNDGGRIASSYSNGFVSGETWYVGGLVGYNEGRITSSFWDQETSGLSESAGGIGLITTEMKNINTFLDAGWDFIGETANGTEDIWRMPVGDYPRLWWE